MKNTFFMQYLWIFKILICVILLTTLYFALKFLLQFLKTKAFIKKYWWKEKLDYILLKPLKYLFLVFAVIYCLDVIFSNFNIDVLKYTKSFRNGFIIFFVAVFLYRWKNIFLQFFFKKDIKKKIFDYVTLDLIEKITSFIIFFIAFLLILQCFNVNIMPLIAFGGVGAAAIGFAAKDVIANFFGGFMLHFTRTFAKNDFIEIPKENILGTVENIGWYFTCIRDLNKCPVYIPNSLFTTAKIQNLSRRTHRKIEETISIRYKDFQKLPLIIDSIKKEIEKEALLDSSIPILVNFNCYKDFSLDIFIRFYISYLPYEEFMNFREKILLKFNKIIQEKKADIPFPTTSVYLEKE